MRWFLIVFLAAFAFSANAQTATEQRAAELEEISILLRDPDPMLRLVAMEEIMATGDRRKISLATSLAMRSEDRALRGAGMVAYMAQHGKIEFDLFYPEPLETQFIEAGLNQEKRTKFFSDATRIGGNFIGAVNLLGRKLPVEIEVDADLMGGKSMVLIGSRGAPGDLRINGDRAEMRFEEFSVGNYRYNGCSLRASPTDDSRIAGHLTCGALDYPVSFEIR